MKSKFLLLIIGCLMMAAVAKFEYCHADAVDDAQSVISGIVMYKMQESGAETAEEWIKKDLIPNAGITAESYAYALAKEGGTDLSGYTSALSRYLKENVVRAATTRLKYALCLTVADRENPYIQDTVNEAVGSQGIMSLVYGLHLYNNGYVSDSYPPGKIISEILSMRHDDDGWSVMGDNSDVDVTAMVLQALAGYKEVSLTDNGGESVSMQDIDEAVGKALEWLSKKQNADGGYSGFGAANAESTAQVLIALSSLGIDCTEDSRFIKDGRSVFDGIALYRLDDGTYSHVAGGESNATATMQVYTAMEAYVTMKQGKGPYYVLGSSSNEEDGAETPEQAGRGGDPIEQAGEGGNEVEHPGNGEGNNRNETGQDGNTAGTGTGQNATGSENHSVNGKNFNGDSGSRNSGYKKIAYIVIAALFVIVSTLLIVFKKRNYKNFIFAAIVALIAVIIVRNTEISSKESYYSGNAGKEAASIGTVTLEIRCDTIVGESAEFIPEDGIVLKKTRYGITGGESVYDLLVEAVKENGIQMENRKTSVGAHGAYYISGINYIYEYDYGELSGWMYYVNGEAPSVGCGEYLLKDGDEVEWLYTREIGRDIVR